MFSFSSKQSYSKKSTPLRSLSSPKEVLNVLPSNYLVTLSHKLCNVCTSSNKSTKLSRALTVTRDPYLHESTKKRNKLMMQCSFIKKLKISGYYWVTLWRLWSSSVKARTVWLSTLRTNPIVYANLCGDKMISPSI